MKHLDIYELFHLFLNQRLSIFAFPLENLDLENKKLFILLVVFAFGSVIGLILFSKVLGQENMDLDMSPITFLTWINEVDIDGYRIDQAYAVPMDFYEEVLPEMKKLKPVFILGETDANHPG